ncbi:MAG TPA: hypothetical protein VK681_39080 [Reyranella sp.]|nr:hypothetical protein [Reyranella sp.]
MPKGTKFNKQTGEIEGATATLPPDAGADLIRLTNHDQSVMRTSLDLLDKAVEAAIKAVTKIGIATLPIDALSAQSVEARKQMNSNIEREEWGLAPHLVPCVRLGISLMVEKLTKIEEAQVELGIMAPDDTKHQLDLARDLAARLRDQLRML